MAARRLAPALPLLFALAACGGSAPAEKDIDALDAQLTEGISVNGADPVVTAALNDQIMVDPQLAAKANADSVRPPSRPYAAPLPAADVAPAPPSPADSQPVKPAPAAVAKANCPRCKAARESITLGALASAQPDRRTAGCAKSVSYAAGWANRLNDQVPLHPAARVIEAAGSATGGCALRVVTFTVARPMQTMLDWYYTRLSNAGVAAEHVLDGQTHVLGGTRAQDGAAYVLYLRPREDGGTTIDLVTNAGV